MYLYAPGRDFGDVPLDQAGEAIGTGLNIWMRHLIKRFSPLSAHLYFVLFEDNS